MPKQPSNVDRNFDDLAERFHRNIYGGLKGEIRLAVLRRDFTDHLPIAPYVPLTPEKTLDILDAGGGQGQFAIPFAAAGHRLTLCDISENMLSRARQSARESGALCNVDFAHQPIQSLPAKGQYHLVLCHAVLEWLADPEAVLRHLARALRPGGHLSLIFYNRHALIYKNLLRTNYGKVLRQDYSAFRGSLTPTQPLTPEQVSRWCESLGLRRLCYSGIRVFYDYILDPEARTREPDSVLELELAYSQQSPYRELGRYCHFLLKKE